MYSIMKSGGRTAYGVKEYTVDFLDDINSINKELCSVGTTALVIETGNIYILNGSKEWKLLSSGGATNENLPPEGSTVIYDGGSVNPSGATIIYNGGNP